MKRKNAAKIDSKWARISEYISRCRNVVFLGIFTLLIVMPNSLFADEFEADEHTLFLAHFNEGIDADFARGEKEQISGRAELASEGRFGKAIMAHGDEFLCLNYPTDGNISQEKSTIEMWYRPNFSLDKPEGLTIYRLFGTGDIKAKKGTDIGINHREGKRYLWFLVWDEERNLKNYGIYKEVKIEKGNWYHIAACWDEKKMSLYLDEKPLGSKDRKGEIPFGGTFSIGCARHPNIADGLIDEFRISGAVRYVPPFEKELLPNASLEKGEKRPVGWDVSKKGQIKGNWELDNYFSKEGKRSIWFEKIKGTGFFSLSTTDFIPVEPNKRYWLTGHIHIQRKSPGVRTYFMVSQYEKGTDTCINIFSPHSQQILPPSKGREWTKSSLLFTPGPKIDRIKVHAIVTGNPSKIWWDDFSLKLYDPAKDKKPYSFKPPELPYTWREVLKTLSSRKNATGKIEKLHGKPRLILNRKIHPPIIYHAPYWNWANAFHSDFSQAGIKIHTVHCPLGPYEKKHGKNSSVWKGHKQYDFSLIEENIKAALRGSPDIYLVVSIAVMPYRLWGEKYPDEVVQDQFGKKGIGKGVHLYTFGDKLGGEDDFWCHSYYSEIFHTETAEVLGALVDYLKKQPYWKSIVGFSLIGGDDGQWNDWALRAHDTRHLSDYSPAAKKAFEKYLKRKYWTNRTLQKAFGDESLTFETLELPPAEDRLSTEMFRHPKKDMLVIEFEKFLSEGVAELVNSCAKTLKEEAGKPVFCITYWADVALIACSNHFAVRTLLNSPYIDITLCPTDYNPWRRPGATGGIGGVTGSLSLHNMLWLQELDLRTWKTYYSSYHKNWGHLATANNIEEFAAINERELGSMISNKMGAWYYDMSGGWFHDESIMENISKCYRIYEEQLTKKDSFRPEMAVIVDEESVFYHSNLGDKAATRHLSTGRQRQSFYLSGVPFDIYVIDDLIDYWQQLSDYKIYVFLNSYYLDEKQRDFIDANLKKNGKTLVWMYAPGYVSEEDLSVENMKALTGITVRTKSGDHQLLAEPVLSDNPLSNNLAPLLVDVDGGYATNQKFWIDDRKAITIACYVQGEEPAIAEKNLDNWRSIYIAAPGALTPQLINNIARTAGAYVVSEQGDIIWLNGNFLSIHGCLGGKKKLNLPKKYRFVKEAFTGKVIARRTDNIEIEIPLAETRWFLLEE